MRTFYLLSVLCALNSFANALYSDEEADIQDTCCSHGQTFALTAASSAACAKATSPDDISPERKQECTAAATVCCQEHFRSKDECNAGMKFAVERRCNVPETEIGKTCCEECSFGRWTGESQGREGCKEPADDEIPSLTLRSYAYYKCCLEAAEEQDKTTTEAKVETTTEKKIVKETCKADSCNQVCNDESGKVKCQCHEGYRLLEDKKTCKDINECNEAIDDVCTEEGTVCHNTAGSFKCVPIKKRETTLTCPAGFKRNVLNQVCDDINECQLPRPPCPKYLCENTIGGYKCGGKPGKPFEEKLPGVPSPPPSPDLEITSPKNDICPPGFRAGPDDECIDVDECEEHADDCQRLSQYCINTHGGFFCQDHVSKRCLPGFMVNAATGKCEDIDECEESTEVCKRSEVCINLAGAYNCKSKISTLPKLATKNCQEGTRLRPGGTVCEDIDECREGTHLCDRFQNCVNTYGAHECRCKNGFELDSATGSCVDIDECALKLDNCAAGLHCLNVLGAYTCTRRAPAPTTRAPTTLPPYEYDYYDSDEDNSTNDYSSFADRGVSSTTSSTTTPKPTLPPPKPTEPPRPPPTYPNYPYRPLSTTTRRTHYTNRSDRPRYLRPTTTSTTEVATTQESTTATNAEETPSTPYEPPSTPELPPRPDHPARPDNPRYPPDRRTEDQPRRPNYRPDRPNTNPVRPEYTPRPRPEPPGNPDLTEVTVPAPENPLEIETEKDNDGSYGLNTSDIPKHHWTSVTGRDKPVEPDFDINNLHCLNGFERDAYGNCVDTNECEENRHICSTLEVCVNMQGGYRCECVSGFFREPSGWCIPVRPSTPTPIHPPTPRATTARTTTSTTTTERPTTEVSTTPRTWRFTPPTRPYRPPYTPPISCELGYTYDSSAGRCIDIDECARNEHICAPKEDCVNQDGGYYCVCSARCRETTDKHPHEVPSPAPTEPYQPSGGESDTNIITVGAQYGQRGPRYLRPTFTRLPNSGAIVTSCPWGYKLTPDKLCYDIDECSKNVSQCGPLQRCENFFGGYSCQCPAGHKLYGKDSCTDIDECYYGSSCPYNAKCINTVGSYRCECGDGFRNSPSNDKVCVDIDECTETPQVCHQSCSNAWGSYRCYCKRGYRLDADNRTCVDVDECAEWSLVRQRGRLCGGECVNEPGSYRCACPAGYRLSDDGKSCIDIDECETGEATCAASRDPGYVCQNTRGSYHCHHIECPPGYKLEAKHRCARIQRSCPISDWACLQRPSAYSYNFITFVANIFLPSGSVDLFTMHGPSWRDSVMTFDLRMIGVQAASGVQPADIRCFDTTPKDNMCVISLLCSLGGPQVAELELTMSLYQRGQFAGNAVARLIIIVSQYEF